MLAAIGQTVPIVDGLRQGGVLAGDVAQSVAQLRRQTTFRRVCHGVRLQRRRRRVGYCGRHHGHGSFWLLLHSRRDLAVPISKLSRPNVTVKVLPSLPM